MELELAGEFGEFEFEDLTGAVEDDVRAWTGGDAAENEDVADVVEVGVVGDGVAQVCADCFVDFSSAGIVLLHERLDVL